MGIHQISARDSRKEGCITILPFWLNLDSFSVFRLSSFIISVFIAVFLFRLKSRSVPTVLMAWTFTAAALINLTLFLEFACPYNWQPYNPKDLLIPFAQVIGTCVAATSLVLVAYFFPHFQKPDRNEFRIVLSLCISANLVTLATAFYNFIVLARGRSEYGFEQTFYIIWYAVLALQFLLTVFLLFRKAVRFSGGKQRPWWQRLIRSRGSDALAARSLALVLCLLTVVVCGYVLMTVGVIPFDLASYFIWLVFQLFYFSFIVTYLNHTVEQTTFQVKLVGLALVFIVGILGLVSMVIGRTHAKDYINTHLITEGQTIQYRPNQFGSYTIDRRDLRFDSDLGSRVEVDSGASRILQLQFAFPFFGDSYRTLHLLHGPMIYLGEEIREYGWGGYHPQPAIAPLLVNLDPSRAGGIYVNNQPEWLTVTWYQMPEAGYYNRNTVQLVLFPDGAFDVSYRELDIRSSYSAIRMYVFTTANLTGQHPGASGEPVPSGPKLIGIHPGGKNLPLQPIRFSHDLPYVSTEPGVIFESYENDFYAYMQNRMSILVIVLVISSLLVLFIFPLLFRTSLIRPLQALYRGMERADSGDLDVSITPQSNDEVGALTRYFNRMLQSIQKAEANFRALAENAQDGILIVLEDGRIAYANRSAEQITKRGGSELVGKSVEEVIRHRKRESGTDWLWKDLDQRLESKHLEAAVLSTGDNSVPVEMTVSQTFWHRTPAVVVLLRDISERRRREEQDRLYQQRLIRTDKLTTLGILAAAIAHDISNPNQVILTASKILNRAWAEVHPAVTERIAMEDQFLIAGFEQEEFLANVGGWLRNIQGNSEKIDSVVKEWKSYIQDEPRTMSSINLSTIVRSAVELIGYHIKRATDHFILELEGATPNIRGNAQQLEQVVINLIMNACQALPDRDRAIEVQVSHLAEQGVVVLSVRDQGCGISQEDLQRIKEAFFTTKKQAGGIGLGLYIVNSIVKEHRGNLDIISSTGKGSEVIVSFPVEERK
ncbi:MAG: PAS domain S-box protein [Spirochaetaceae bacterium]|nr:MAG: PAS domain S-box protein [Spirochaetaceae bacterium]